MAAEHKRRVVSISIFATLIPFVLILIIDIDSS